MMSFDDIMIKHGMVGMAECVLKVGLTPDSKKRSELLLYMRSLNAPHSKFKIGTFLFVPKKHMYHHRLC